MNQLLASAGFGSRRQCEELIREGRVLVDGEIVTELGTMLDLSEHKIQVDGVPLKPQKLVYYAVHKPKGVVSTNYDPQGRPRVIDLVPPTERVFPVGRLDRNSDGLILLTNDGDLAQQLAHPKFGVTKIYRVTVAGEVRSETMRKMREGIYIAEGLVQVDGAKILKARKTATDMEIRLREGKNREIRRILAKFGHKVQTLRRIAIGPLKLGEVPAGAYRKLTHVEIDKLRNIANQAANAPEESLEERANPRRTNKTGVKTAKRPGQSSRPRGSGSRPPAGAIAEASSRQASKKRSTGKTRPPAGDRPLTKNRRPVKQKRTDAPAPDRDSLRVGSVIMGDEFKAVDPKPKTKKRTTKKAGKKPTRASVSASRKRKGKR
ncbi:pseudouridine synthase [Neorhodopirellula pilleata]|uniref:pseudouridine synthase n=1 Tax=Neorhodopirellula pilleata TaxID=2714738 RepID=UPI001E3F7DBD|nr:pseudouridine synthase [Neorhodopirellula pilleata]